MLLKAWIIIPPDSDVRGMPIKHGGRVVGTIESHHFIGDGYSEAVLDITDDDLLKNIKYVDGGFADMSEPIFSVAFEDTAEVE